VTQATTLVLCPKNIDCFLGAIIPEGQPGREPEYPIIVDEQGPIISAAASDGSNTPASTIGDQFNNFSSQTTQLHGPGNMSSQSTVAADRQSEERGSAEVPLPPTASLIEASYIASQIAELRVRSMASIRYLQSSYFHFQAEIEALERPKMAEPRGEKRRLSTDEEVDLKPDVAGLELMVKKLKYASAFDGTFMDLAAADEYTAPTPVTGPAPFPTVVLPQPPALEAEADLKPDIAGLLAMGEKLVEAKKQDDAFVDLVPEGVATTEGQLVSQPA
jgi:hypothetical protein